MIDVHPKDWRSETFTRNTISHFGESVALTWRALTWNFSVDWLAIAWLQCVGIYRSDFVQKSPVLPVLLGCNWNAIVGRVPSTFGGNWGSLSCWCNPCSGLVTGRRFSFEKSNRAYWIILIHLRYFWYILHHWLWSPSTVPVLVENHCGNGGQTLWPGYWKTLKYGEPMRDMFACSATHVSPAGL